MFGGNGISLADIGALLGNRNSGGSGWGDGNGWWVLIILFALFGGWGNNGYGNRGGESSSGGGSSMPSYIPFLQNATWTNGALTRADLCQDMNFQEVQNGIREISGNMPTLFANLNSTICNQQYDTARMFNSLENVVQAAANQSNIVALQNQNALQTQIAQCCCDTKSLFAQAEYNRATDTCAITRAIQDAARDIIQNDNCNYRQLHDEQIALQIQGYKDRISEQNQAINALNLAQSQANQNAYLVNTLRPTPIPAYFTPNPYTAYPPFGVPQNCCCGNQVFGTVA